MTSMTSWLIKMIDDFVVKLKNEQQHDMTNLQLPQGVLRQRTHPDSQLLAIIIFKEIYDIDDELVEPDD